MSADGGVINSLAYGLGVGQLAIMFCVVMYFPISGVQVFVYSPCVSNGTLMHACGSTHTTRLLLPLPCMTVSAAASAFVSSTFSLAESGVMGNDSPYGAEALGQTGLWNVLFWFIVAGAHAIVVTAACSPVDAFAACSAAYLMVHFLAKLCSARGSDSSGSDQSAGSVTIANANILGYMLGVCVALYCVPPQYSNRYVLLFLLVTLDYFLGVGHVWDKSPTMGTVANCRLFWVCSAVLCLAALYGAWNDDLLLPGNRDVGQDDA